MRALNTARATAALSAIFTARPQMMRMKAPKGTAAEDWRVRAEADGEREDRQRDCGGPEQVGRENHSPQAAARIDRFLAN